MAATLKATCESCGTRHDLFLPNVDMADAFKRYEYTCPFTGDVLPLKEPSDWWHVVAVKPAGAVIVNETGRA